MPAQQWARYYRIEEYRCCSRIILPYPGACCQAPDSGMCFIIEIILLHFCDRFSTNPRIHCFFTTRKMRVHTRFFWLENFWSAPDQLAPDQLTPDQLAPDQLAYCFFFLPCCLKLAADSSGIIWHSMRRSSLDSVRVLRRYVA